MGDTKRSAFRWVPRSLGILLAGFVSLFALEAENLTDALIHLSPLVLPILLAVLSGWRHPVAGAIAFFVLTVAATLFFHTYRRLDRFLITTAPPLAIGMLFLLQWRLSSRR